MCLYDIFYFVDSFPITWFCSKEKYLSNYKLDRLTISFLGGGSNAYANKHFGYHPKLPLVPHFCTASLVPVTLSEAQAAPFVADTGPDSGLYPLLLWSFPCWVWSLSFWVFSSSSPGAVSGLKLPDGMMFAVTAARKW